MRNVTVLVVSEVSRCMSHTVMLSVLLPSMLTLVMTLAADALPHLNVVVTVPLPPAAFDG